MKTLLTGFGPFGKVIDNPTSRICKLFDTDDRITTRVLPVSYSLISEHVNETLTQTQWDAIILMGVKAGSRTITIETTADNTISPDKPDADGYQPEADLIYESGPMEYKTTVELSGLQEYLTHKRVDVEYSTNAGGYLCNYLYYQVLTTLYNSGMLTPCVFLHVPADDQTGPDLPGHRVPIQKSITAVTEVINFLTNKRTDR